MYRFIYFPNNTLQIERKIRRWKKGRRRNYSTIECRRRGVEWTVECGHNTRGKTTEFKQKQQEKKTGVRMSIYIRCKLNYIQAVRRIFSFVDSKCIWITQLFRSHIYSFRIHLIFTVFVRKWNCKCLILQFYIRWIWIRLVFCSLGSRMNKMKKLEKLYWMRLR